MKNPLPTVTIQCRPQSPISSALASFSIHVSQFQLKAFEQALEEIDDSVFRADEIVINSEGITLKGTQLIQIRPSHNWDELMAQIGSSTFAGTTAIQILRSAKGDFDDILVDDALSRLDTGETTFEELRDENPYLFEIPRFAFELASEFLAGTKLHRGRGKPQRYNSEQINLYHHVSAYERSGKSQLQACKTVVEEHPHIIPENWVKSGEPHELLRKLVRRLDRHSQFSQKVDG